eukprot:TRINITY_DN60279_c0_g1_i1.p1 TRINITY_DN60279_c0_g1~~TRINITY_DN60279_c0_g1_i1.p1  ORF type:complete len:254 (+),score=38.32 TRINITY_DN60279_c0_g1_i1:112-873(+)
MLRSLVGSEMCIRDSMRAPSDSGSAKKLASLELMEALEHTEQMMDHASVCLQSVVRACIERRRFMAQSRGRHVGSCDQAEFSRVPEELPQQRAVSEAEDHVQERGGDEEKDGTQQGPVSGIDSAQGNHQALDHTQGECDTSMKAEVAKTEVVKVEVVKAEAMKAEVGTAPEYGLDGTNRQRGATVVTKDSDGVQEKKTLQPEIPGYGGWTLRWIWSPRRLTTSRIPTSTTSGGSCARWRQRRIRTAAHRSRTA